MTHTPVTMLIILDGFGWREEKKYNAIAHARTPHLDQWFAEYPHAFLKASGTAVGLPQGYIGNSEVGHLTIGAGRIIKSPICLVNEAIKNRSFFSNPALLKTVEQVKKADSALHIMGLLSNAGVHADIHQLYAYIKAAHDFGIRNIILHLFLDGRDSPPKSAAHFLQNLEKEIKKTGAVIGSIHGRYYAMDRDKHWDRTEQSYRILTEPQNNTYYSWQNALNHYYQEGITDEFIPPTLLHEHAIIKNGDGIIFINFRPDRARQLTAAFVNPNFNEFKTKHLTLSGFVTPVSYDGTIKTDVMYETPIVTPTLTQTLASHNKTIFAIAETEKYAHITYFFNGGKETPEATETRTLIPSHVTMNVKTSPCMAAPNITHAVLTSLQQNPCDFYLINYANADIIGHTGNFNATVAAVECLDRQLGQLYEQVIEKMNGTLYIAADHGNAEDMFDETSGQPRTSHTSNPVPFIWINKKESGNNTQLPLQQLRDIAPFILKHMDISVPKKMEE